MYNKNLIFFSLKVIALFFFLIVNIPLIWMLALYSGSLFLEIYKWLQLISIILVLYVFKNKIITFPMANLIYLFYSILAGYYIFTDTKLDSSFLLRNLGEIDDIVPRFIYQFSVVFSVASINSFILYKFRPNFKNKFFYIIPILFIISPQLIHRQELNNELICFVESIFKKDKVIDYYQSNYIQLIQDSIKRKHDIIGQARKINKEQLPKYLENIIILQIESLNADLVNERNTPYFTAISREGIFFPKIYGNSVQTILGQENMLCSLPCSFDVSLVATEYDKQVLSLPKILKGMGFKTFFLKCFHLSFTRSGEFMTNIDFDEVHGVDIMGPKDVLYRWGYKGDIFYKRAFDYFQKNKKEKYNFIFLSIGATNHWPFNITPGFEDIVPYKYPKNFRERFINTTFLQDQYLQVAWREINNIFPEKNYTLIITGDHSWPAGFHENNIFGGKGAFEENFVTSTIMIIGDEEKYKNKIITTRYSLMDIMPSILDLFGLNFVNKFSRSFIKELNGEEVPKSKILLVQPFSDKYLNIIDWPLKYQYNSHRRNIVLYNLEEDPGEENSQIISNNEEENLQFIRELLN
ncbi:MAG: sulfatase-like hydrolase/transferase [bacterium]